MKIQAEVVRAMREAHAEGLALSVTRVGEGVQPIL